MQEIVKNIINKAVPPLLVIAAVVFLFVFTDIFKKEPPVSCATFQMDQAPQRRVQQ